jgi:hypothetical protein
VLSGRGLCFGLVTHPEESYRLWRVVVCDLETSRMRKPLLSLGRSAIIIIIIIIINIYTCILRLLSQSGPCILQCCSSVCTLYGTGWPEFVHDW